MRKTKSFFAALTAMLFMCVPAFAGTMTITFDEVAPLNGICLTEEYADSGLHFVPTLQGACDASTYDTPWHGIADGTNGSQIMGSDGAIESNGSKSAGFVIEFDFDVESVQIDLNVSAETTTTEPLNYMLIRGSVFAGFGNIALPAANQWTTITMAPNSGTFTALVVYVPAGNDDDGYTEAILAFDNLVINGDTPCPTPGADFSADPASGYAPLTVGFADDSTDASSWSWDFGDGATSTDQNPTHTYNDAGTYAACLTVSNECGSDSVCLDIVVDPQPCDPPTACFTADPESGEAPLAVSFTDCSADAVAWAWDFGDGSTATDRNPIHTFSDEGTYQVCLTVTNDCGATDSTCADIVVDPTPEPPVAAFSGTPTAGCAALTVSFTDESTGAPATWSWDFGDGETSGDQNPTHTYSDPGTYTVTLNVVNDNGFDDEIKVDYITVTECQGPAVHVKKMYVWKQVWYGWTPYCRGRAWVQVVDESGKAVADATVTAEWSDAIDETVTFTTNFSGWGICSSNWIPGTSEGPVKCIENFTLCVTDITKDGASYDPGANVETCKSTD